MLFLTQSHCTLLISPLKQQLTPSVALSYSTISQALVLLVTLLSIAIELMAEVDLSS